MDWVDPILSEPAEESEKDMSSLAVEFVAWMRKRAASNQRETTSGFKGPDDKPPKQYGSE